MASNDALLNIMTNAGTAAAPYLAIHTALPDATGSNQATSPRIAAGWPTAAQGDAVVTNKAFTGGAPGGPALYLGKWSALTNGVFYGATPLTGDTTFNSAGEVSLLSYAFNAASA